MRRLFIEPLEPRIAPATLTGQLLTFNDVDGDKVSISFSKGTLTQQNFLFKTSFNDAGPQQLQRIDVSGVADIEGSNITVSVVKAAGGDGVANIGEIIATGRDLGVVKTKGDLGKIVAGNKNSPAPAITALKIGSYAMFDQATQPAGGLSASLISGDLPLVTIARDFGTSPFSVTGDVTKLKIGGSIIGGSTGSAGRLVVNGDLTKATIGGSMIGGPGLATGTMTINGNLGTLLIRGSLLGGSFGDGSASAQIDVAGAVDSITILGDVRGATGSDSAPIIDVNGKVGQLTIGGSVTATDGRVVAIVLAETVKVPGVAVESVLIKGSTQNMLLSVGSNFNLPQAVTVDQVTIGGSFLKSRIAIGAARGEDMVLGTADDTLNAASQLNTLVIKGPAAGTLAQGDSYVIEAGRIGSATVGGRSIPGKPGAQVVILAPSGDVLLKDQV